ncbi:MAG: B12-binding domain-containing radical SAM protein, partial [Anaerolineales bacterium]
RSAATLEAGYWRTYRDFYRWGSILRSADAHNSAVESLRHFAYAAGWKKFEPLWDWVIRLQRVSSFLPLLEAILASFGGRESGLDALGMGEQTKPDLPEPVP